jgi:putative ABC transport system permease protein
MHWFRIKQTIKLGAKSLWMHRLRSTLTALGIIFGVSSVIAMLAIGEGASQQAQDQIAQLGSTNIIIKTVKPPEKITASSDQQTVIEYGLTYADAERFHQTIANAQVIVPVRRITQQAWYRSRRVAVEVVGTVPWYTEMAPIRLMMGRFLSSIDTHYTQPVCVVDRLIVDELFLFDDPIGQDIKIAGEYYRVVGIVSAYTPVAADPSVDTTQTSSLRGGGVAGNIYIPLTTAKSRFGEVDIQLGGSTGMQGEKVQLHEITVKVADIEQVLVTRDVLDAILDRFHKKQDYQIVVPLELLRQPNESSASSSAPSPQSHSSLAA